MFDFSFLECARVQGDGARQILEAFTDRAKINNFQAYLRDVWTEVSRLKKEGVSAAEAAKRADLTKHKQNFPTINGPGVPLIAVTRIYELLDSRK